MIRPKKYLGQHFLQDQNIAKKIVGALELSQDRETVIEVGPGTGVLTQYLVENPCVNLTVVEIDEESIIYLNKSFKNLKIVSGDFLEIDLDDLIPHRGIVIGNFPYNISSQIFFKILESKNKVFRLVGMLQKEVAQRIASGPGNKTYGILSVLLQAYYDIELLFSVPPGVFFPPPKVHSAVIRLKRNSREKLEVDEALFKRVVKQSFQNRRKMLRNALKPLSLTTEILAQKIMEKRAEQLWVNDFIELTRQIENSK